MPKKDANQLAKFILDVTTGEDKNPDADRKPTDKVIGRNGGKVGGKARARKLTEEQRSKIASKAAQKRWGNSQQPPKIQIAPSVVMLPGLQLVYLQATASVGVRLTYLNNI